MLILSELSTLTETLLLKRQHRTKSKAVLPPEADFTKHYSTHYELGAETPLSVSGCELFPSDSDELLSQGRV